MLSLICTCKAALLFLQDGLNKVSKSRSTTNFFQLGELKYLVH